MSKLFLKLEDSENKITSEVIIELPNRDFSIESLVDHFAAFLITLQYQETCVRGFIDTGLYPKLKEPT